MRCDRCGRDNPEQLRFCQDCGNRLSAAHGVPPTPPRGVIPAPTSLQTAVRAGPAAHPEVDAPAQQAERARGHASGCTRCGTINPAENNFCSTCGAPVAADPAAPPPRQAAAPGAPAAAAALAPTAAVPVASEMPIVCPRCRGNNAARMSFCQFCGARLAAHAPERSVPPPPRRRWFPQPPRPLDGPHTS